MVIGSILKLTGKTKHGKNRVREQGALWMVIELCTAKRHGAHQEGTPLALLRAVDNAKHWRWIRQADDLNFMTEVRQEND